MKETTTRDKRHQIQENEQIDDKYEAVNTSGTSTEVNTDVDLFKSSEIEDLLPQSLIENPLINSCNSSTLNEDSDWQLWLAQLANEHFDAGIEQSIILNDDDIEKDPDFNYLDSEVMPDKEAYRSDNAVRISKRELDDLLDEFDQTPFSTNAENKSSTPIKYKESDIQSHRSGNSSSVKTKKLKLDIDYSKKYSVKVCSQFFKEYLKLPNVIQKNDFLKKHPMLQKLIRDLKQLSVKSKADTSPQFTDDQRYILQQQIQMHVQLLLQSNLLCRNIEEQQISLFSEECHQLLSELNYFKEAKDLKDTSAFNACNLPGALELCLKPLPVTKSMDTMPKSILKKGLRPITKSLARMLASSSVFMYMELLPLSAIVAPNLTSQTTVPFSFNEDCLIAFGISELSDLNDYLSILKAIYMPSRSRKSIKIRIKNVISGNSRDNNPIKMFKLHGTLPAADSSISHIEAKDTKKPMNITQHRNMPYWLETLQYNKMINKNKQIEISNQRQFLTSPNNTSNLYFIPIIPPTHRPSLNSNALMPPTCIAISSISKTSTTQTRSIESSITNTDSLISPPTSKDDFIRPAGVSSAIYSTIVEPLNQTDRRDNIVTQVNGDAITNMPAVLQGSSGSVILDPETEKADTIDQNENKVNDAPELGVEVENIEVIPNERNTDSDVENVQDESPPKPVEVKENDFKASNNICNSNKRKKKTKPSLRIKLFKANGGLEILNNNNKRRKQKGLRKIFSDNHIHNNSWQDPEKEETRAANYLLKVQEVLKDEPSKFFSFLDIMNKFSSGTDSASKLFSQIKDLLFDFNDLIEEFISFLLPLQAMECGVYKEYFIINNARKFLHLVESSYKNNPQQLEKIMFALHDIDNSVYASESEIKQCVMPLLKETPELQDLFIMFFGDEKVPEAFYNGDVEEVYLTEEMIKNKSYPLYEQVSLVRKNHKQTENGITSESKSNPTIKNKTINGNATYTHKNINEKVIDREVVEQGNMVPIPSGSVSNNMLPNVKDINLQEDIEEDATIEDVNIEEDLDQEENGDDEDVYMNGELSNEEDVMGELSDIDQYVEDREHGNDLVNGNDSEDLNDEECIDDEADTTQDTSINDIDQDETTSSSTSDLSNDSFESQNLQPEEDIIEIVKKSQETEVKDDEFKED